MKYDLALDLQGAIRSALAAQVSGAPGRVGSSQPREKPATMFYTRQVDPRGAHVVEQALSLASEVAGRRLTTSIRCSPSIPRPKPGPSERWRNLPPNDSRL